MISLNQPLVTKDEAINEPAGPESVVNETAIPEPTVHDATPNEPAVEETAINEPETTDEHMIRIVSKYIRSII